MVKTISKTCVAIAVATFALILMALASTALAGKPNTNPSVANGINHPGKASQLHLYQKDSNWNVVEDGAYGKLTFNYDGGFAFNGHGLNTGTDYTLVRYNGADWPGAVCMASGVANGGGNLALHGDFVDNGSDKVWLVLSSDVDCDNEAMTGWNPASYLFENNLI